MPEKKIGNHVQQEKKAMRLPSYRKLLLGLGFEIYRGIVNIGYPVTFKNQQEKTWLPMLKEGD